MLPTFSFISIQNHVSCTWNKLNANHSFIHLSHVMSSQVMSSHVSLVLKVLDSCGALSFSRDTALTADDDGIFSFTFIFR